MGFQRRRGGGGEIRNKLKNIQGSTYTSQRKMRTTVGREKTLGFETIEIRKKL